MAEANSPNSVPSKTYPKDGLVVISMMKDLGITSYEPRVVNQLLEFTYRYVSSVLDDARAFATHSRKTKAIDNEDVRLAVMMQLERNFTTPPPRDLLLEVARSKNSVPLPLVKPHCGIRLPPDRYCFSSCNYKLRSNATSKKPDNKILSKFAPSGGGGGTGGLGSASIKVNKSVIPSTTVSSGQTSIKRPPNLSTKTTTWISSPKTSSPSVISKPVIKLSTGGGTSTSLSSSGNTMVVTKGGSGGLGQAQQVHVKLEPMDTGGNSGKRKREDEE